MKQDLRFFSVASLLCLTVAQVIRPSFDNPPVNPARSLWNDPGVDPRVANVLRRSCANCHSYETEWPWYSKISPVSWLIARHVKNGRAKLNFSEWSGATANQLEEIYDAIDKNEMPPADYSLMHPEARLSEADREVLKSWTEGKVVPVR